jgi:signal transduction histidine kinase
VTGRSTLIAAAVAALLGAVATLLAGAGAGMGPNDLADLAAALAAATAVTLAATAGVAWILRRSRIRTRLLAVSLLGSLVALANLLVLAKLMFVDADAAEHLLVPLLYAGAAGAAAAFALGRSSSRGIERLVAATERFAEGDLAARAAPLGADADLDELARRLDAMAVRLERSIDRERAADAQRRDLITAVSHDLRTPLTGLRAMVETVSDGLVDDPESFCRYAAEMGRAVDALSALVDDLFEFVQLDAGAIQAASEPVLLRQVVQSVLATCEPQAAGKGLMVEARIDEVGATPCSPHLERVLQNLIQNAIRHTPADGSVCVRAHRDEGGLELTVEDTGEGLEPQAVERVFDPFWRGDSARVGDGSGLGLALAKRIVEALGGEISVRSEPQRGSRFAVSVPVV